MVDTLLGTGLPLLLLLVAFIFPLLGLWAEGMDRRGRRFLIAVLLLDLLAVVVVMLWSNLHSGLMIGLFAVCLSLAVVHLSRSKTQPEQQSQKALDDKIDYAEATRNIALFSVFNNLHDLVLVTNLDGMVVFMNMVAIRRFGDGVGFPCHAVLGCDTEQCKTCSVRMEGEELRLPQNREMVVKNRQYDFSITPIRNDSEGRCIQIARDITEKKQLETQILMNEKMASLGQLVAGVAHEINNPVTVLTNNLEIWEMLQGNLSEQLNSMEKLLGEIRSEGKTGLSSRIDELLPSGEENPIREMQAQLPDMAQDMLDAIGRVRMIVRDLKEFSHHGGEQPYEENLNKLIKQTLRISHHELKRNITVVEELDEKLPPFIGYPQQIKQVLLNLIVNAAHAMQEKEQGELLIRTGADNGQVFITVADNGSGMPEDVREHIFEPFFTTKEVGTGTGLGLSVVYGIIQRHGGEIKVESEPGKGTRFYIVLPRIIPSERERLIEESKQLIAEQQ